MWREMRSTEQQDGIPRRYRSFGMTKTMGFVTPTERGTSDEESHLSKHTLLSSRMRLTTLNLRFNYVESSISRLPPTAIACFGGQCRGDGGYPMRTRLSRNALAITETELKLIARAAIIGDSKIPKKGNNTPAAIGTPNML